MATVNEQIVTGRKFRKLVDEATKLWQRISFWTKASDVEFDDGQTAENKMGAISGITSDLNGESENVAASIKALNELNNKLMFKLPDDVQLIVEGSGADVKYYAQLGADTASKKLLGANLVTKTINISSGQTITLTADNDITMACLVSIENRAFQGTYDKINGSYSGYGDCTISASGKTLTIASGRGPSGRWRISYC